MSAVLVNITVFTTLRRGRRLCLFWIGRCYRSCHRTSSLQTSNG